MAEYKISIIPIDKLVTLSNGQPGTPWSNGYHDPSGGQWNYVPWTVSYDVNDVTSIDISDKDNDPEHLNDNSWWMVGRGTQTIQTAIGHANVGADITDEYELHFTATVDGEVKTYTLAAIATINPNESQLSPASYIGFTFDGPWPPSGTVLTYVPNSNADNSTLNVAEQAVPCFCKGTLINTPIGYLPIENLRKGDLVITKDRGPQAICWIGSSKINASRLARNEKIRPIRIRAGALGSNMPTQDLLVSPQHRVLVRSKIAQRMFGTSEVLVAAKQLLQLDGIDVAADLAEVEYFHILFDRHEVVFSNGAETESLYTGPEALEAVGRAALEEIFALFPDLRERDNTPEPAHPIVSGKKARKLAIRHRQAGRRLIG